MVTAIIYFFVLFLLFVSIYLGYVSWKEYKEEKDFWESRFHMQSVKNTDCGKETS